MRTIPPDYTIRLPARDFRIAIPRHVSAVVLGASIIIASFMINGGANNVSQIVAENSQQLAMMNVCLHQYDVSVPPLTQKKKAGVK